MKFSIKDFFSKCDQIRSADLVTFTEEILNGKIHFLYSAYYFWPSRCTLTRSEFFLPEYK